jgi:hypothetical protein
LWDWSETWTNTRLMKCHGRFQKVVSFIFSATEWSISTTFTILTERSQCVRHFGLDFP